MSNEQMAVEIRPETAADLDAIFEINLLAFGKPAEAALVNALREAGELVVSLAAVENNQIVGHIAFSPVTVSSSERQWHTLALGPMAVLPDRQNSGIGSRLVRAGLEACRAHGARVVFVLGHANFYPRFGFRPTRPIGIRWEHPCAPENFMAAELAPNALGSMHGVVRYSSAFDSV